MLKIQDLKKVQVISWESRLQENDQSAGLLGLYSSRYWYQNDHLRELILVI